MAQPKRRWSKARTHSKRSTWKKEEPKFATCPNCNEPVLPHRVCGRRQPDSQGPGWAIR